MVTSDLRGTGQRLVIFDVCDTLYDANTTIGFIRHFHSLHGGREFDRHLRRWLSKGSFWFYVGAAADRFLGWDIAREKIVATLAGKSRSELIEAARDYVANVLPHRENEALHERLAKHLADGDRVMLLSSSLDIVVAEIAARLRIDYRASELGFQGEECTGRLRRDLTGRKPAAIADLLETAAAICVYTDNRSDKDLLELADRSTIVIPPGSPDVRWGGSSCEYIRL